MTGLHGARNTNVNNKSDPCVCVFDIASTALCRSFSALRQMDARVIILIKYKLQKKLASGTAPFYSS